MDESEAAHGRCLTQLRNETRFLFYFFLSFFYSFLARSLGQIARCG